MSVSVSVSVSPEEVLLPPLSGMSYSAPPTTRPIRMLAQLQGFFALLRDNGVPVSVAETLDALRAAELVGLGDPGTLAAALAAALIKRPAHRPIFDDLFALYFLHRGAHGVRRRLGSLLGELEAGGFSEEEIEPLVSLLGDQGAALGASARMVLGLEPSSIESVLRQRRWRIDLSRLENPLQIDFYTEQLVTSLGLRDAETEVEALAQRLAFRLGGDRARAMGSVLSRRLGALRQRLRQFVGEALERQNPPGREPFRAWTLDDKPFIYMTEAEIRRLTEEVTRLGRKLRQTAAQRRRVQRRGRLDPRATLQRSRRSGGVPFELKYKRRRIEKPRLVLLCDISDSVRLVSRFMLQFAYILQDQFSQVRSFAFVSDVAEITNLFREHELHRAIDMAHRGRAVNVFAHSNYGRALAQFHARFLDVVTPKTTVIILGDARNNYFPDESWALAEVRARARHVLWLNPEPETSWCFGDSVMLRYQAHCDRVEIVRNLQSLRRVIDSLVL